MRFNKVGIIEGTRGTGKSLFLLGSKYSAKKGDDELNINGLIEAQLKNNFKVLIIDTLDHPSYRKIAVIPQKNINKFNNGVGRVFMNPEKIIQFVKMVNQAPVFNNTFFVFEDAGKYTGNRLPIDFKILISDSKQRNIDIVFMYHCWAETPLDIFRKGLDYIQLFKTDDGPVVRKNNLSLYEKIENIYKRIKQNKSRFYSEFIDTSTI